MRLVVLHDGIGATLARDVPSALPTPRPLLRAGAVLTPGAVRGLQAAGLTRAWVADGAPEPRELLPETTRQALAVRLAPILAAAGVPGQPLSRTRQQQLDVLADVVLDRVAAGADAPQIADVAPASTFPARHAIGACALGLLLARELAAGDPRWAAALGRGHRGGEWTGLRRLGVALLVHEAAHPAPRAADALAGGHLHAVTIVRQHTERWDGLGPEGLAGDAIDPLARVAAVACRVDAMVRRAPARCAHPVAAALDHAATQAGTALDGGVVAALLAVIPRDDVTDLAAAG